jgi:hypothetical protein
VRSGFIMMTSYYIIFIYMRMCNNIMV